MSFLTFRSSSQSAVRHLKPATHRGRSKVETLLIVIVSIVLGWLYAHHQAKANTVELYGRAHISVDHLSDGDNSGLNVSSNASRFGLRGTADLGDGLQGILQIEQEFRGDHGGGNLASRDTFIGLQGGFGSLRLGLIDSPLKSIRSTVDFFGDQIGDARNLTRLNHAPYNQDADARFQNSLYYSSPKLADKVVLNLQYATNLTSGTNPPDDEATGISTSVVYNHNNWYLSLAYEQQEARNDSTALRVGARYSTGDWVFAGLAQTVTVKSLEPSEDVQTLGVGASYKFSPKWLGKAQVYALSADRDNGDALLAAVGADYVFSRNFRVLLALAVVNNDDAASYRVSGGGGHGDVVTPLAGETGTGLSAGFRYDF